MGAELGTFSLKSPASLRELCVPDDHNKSGDLGPLPPLKVLSPQKASPSAGGVDGVEVPEGLEPTVGQTISL